MTGIIQGYEHKIALIGFEDIDGASVRIACGLKKRTVGICSISQRR
jgi:hypothetical protein